VKCSQLSLAHLRQLSIGDQSNQSKNTIRPIESGIDITEVSIHEATSDVDLISRRSPLIETLIEKKDTNGSYRNLLPFVESKRLIARKDAQTHRAHMSVNQRRIRRLADPTVGSIACVASTQERPNDDSL
jgi:hypothetical protein